MKKTCSLIFGMIIVFMLAMTSCGGSVEPADVTLSNIKTGPSAGHSAYGTMTFDFAGEDGAQYQCMVTGIGNIGSLNEAEQNDIANTLGGYFAAGSRAQISGAESCSLIDAEKYGGKDNASQASYGDANLCWAASVADMMVAGGWTDSDEDDVMSEFTDAYFDDGSFQATGIQYYLNGVNPDQVCEEEANSSSSRDAVFSDSEEEGADGFFTSTQVRHPGTADGKLVNSGHANDVAADCVYEKMYASDAPEKEMADVIISALDEGSSVGIQLVFYNGESRVGLHALTVFGYIKDTEGDLKALILADSDNDVDWGKAYPDSTEATLSERSARPDTYDMFLTESYTHNETNYVKLSDYEYSNPKLKYTDAVIHGITVLRSRSAAEKFKESGIGDSVNEPDAAVGSAKFSELETDLTAKKGENVSMPFIFFNESYKGYAANDRPVVKFRYIFYKDDKKVGEQSFELKLVTDEYTTGEANCGISVENPYTFSEAGTYRVGVEIEGVYSENGGKLADAFKGNNYLKEAGTVTVE